MTDCITNHKDEPENEEAALGIYEDSDEGDDLSDNEPPIREEERPQSQFKIRHMSARNIPTNHTARSTESHLSNHAEDTASDMTSVSEIVGPVPTETMSNLGLEEKPTPATEKSEELNEEKSDEDAKVENELDADIEIDPRLKSADNYHNKGINYIHRKCVSSTTRRPFHEFRESPLFAGESADSVKRVYLTQNRPAPMDPLAAWKGYNGNIYFEPIKISRASSACFSPRSAGVTSSFGNHSVKLKSRQSTAKPDTSRLVLHCDFVPRPVVQLDRQTVMNKSNKDVQEDLEWIRLREDIGSLRVERGPGDKAKDCNSRKSLCKGSMAHQIALERAKTTAPNNRHSRSQLSQREKQGQPPNLKIVTAQKTRQTMNSPDIIHFVNTNNTAHTNKLPIVEKAKSRQLQRSCTTQNQKIFPQQKLAYVKYSREVK